MTSEAGYKSNSQWRSEPRHVVTVGVPTKLAEALRAQLAEGGHSVESVRSAEGAIGVIGRRRVDAFVVGIDLPDTRLGVLIAWIRGSNSTCTAMVLAVATSDADEREARTAGADSVLRAAWSVRGMAREIAFRLELTHLATA
jgi:DNA-binding response OmpR family regulator